MYTFNKFCVLLWLGRYVTVTSCARRIHCPNATQSPWQIWVDISRGHTRTITICTTSHTVYPKKYARGFCFAVLCCGYTLTDFPISIRLTSLALWQSNDCPSASKATLMNMDKYFMWIHYERLHNHNKAKHNKIVCIFLGIYCSTKRYAYCMLGCNVLPRSKYVHNQVRIQGPVSI